MSEVPLSADHQRCVLLTTTTRSVWNTAQPPCSVQELERSYAECACEREGVRGRVGERGRERECECESEKE